MLAVASPCLRLAPHPDTGRTPSRDLFSVALDVAANELTSLPENLPAGLQVLRTNANQLARLPERLPASLRNLELQSNQLTTLPPEPL